MLQMGTEIVAEKRTGGYWSGYMCGRDARGRIQIGTPTGRIYPVRPGRYIVVNSDTDSRDWAALYVSQVYRWSRVGDGVQCTHPDDGARSYHIHQVHGEWSCSCEAFSRWSFCKHIQAYSLINDRPSLQPIQGRKSA